MNSNTAIRNGGLTGKPRFFGSSTAEVVSTAANAGSWNADHSYSMTASNPWARRGRPADSGANAGIFAFTAFNGDATSQVGHRTILSGY